MVNKPALVNILTRALLDIGLRDRIARKDTSLASEFNLDEGDLELLWKPNLRDGPHAWFEITIIRAMFISERTASIPGLATAKSIDAPDHNDRLNALATTIRNAAGSERMLCLSELIKELEPDPDEKPKPLATKPPYEADDVDIFIVGLGINGFDQVTPEARNAMSKSKEVFYVSSSIGTKEYMESIGVNATDLMDAYVEGQDRMVAYRTMAQRVVDKALEGGPVTLAEYGHPTVFAYPPFIIQKLAKILNLKVKVLPGISAMDCMFAELMIDPAQSGLQMFEATDIILRNRTLLTDTALFVWQIGAVETSLYSTGTSRPERFSRILSHLLKFYPPQHKIKAICCSNHPLIGSTIYEFELWSMPNHADVLHSGFTLYIPPIKKPESIDYFLVSDARSAEHLKKISDV